jgi:hypothetical protein
MNYIYKPTSKTIYTRYLLYITFFKIKYGHLEDDFNGRITIYWIFREVN